MPNKTLKKDGDSIKFLIGASVLTLLISFIPLGWILVYPLRLFVTFIHEGGHAMAAWLTLGSVDRLIIYADASGETYTRGGLQPVIASAGYLTSTAFGVALLLLSRQGKNAKSVLSVTAGLILVITALFAGDIFSWVTGIFLTIGIIWIAIGASLRIAHFFLNFLAVQCCLNALFDLRTLFLVSANTGLQSDAVTMEQLTMVPAIVWASCWLILSITALTVALRKYAVE